MWKSILSIWKSDSLLDIAWKKSFEMLEITQEMFFEAIRILRESDDTELRQEIRQMDKKVNAFEREVRREVMIHLTVQGSTSLASGLVLLVVVIDIERIGDYVKNMVDLVVHRPQTLEGGLFEGDLQKVEAAVRDSFIRTRKCIEVSDKNEALQLLDEYAWVNRECNDTERRLLQDHDMSLTSSEAVALALYFRYLKRINSHLRNIASSVVNPYDRIGFKPGSE